jgi:drug/metabolite transporter (DMT)-like permease
MPYVRRKRVSQTLKSGITVTPKAAWYALRPFCCYALNEANMSIPFAYLGVILIWATTPLAIRWSGDGVGFLFGITSRMLIGLVTGLLVAVLLGIRLPRDRTALLTYLAAGLGLFSAMLSVYYAVRFIPTGLVSVLFGLAPLITGVLAHFLLAEQLLTPVRILGILTGITGLAVMLWTAGSLGPGAPTGIAGMLVSVTAYSISAVAIKRIDAAIPPLATTVGGLAVTVPLLFLVYLASGTALPPDIAPRTAIAIVYLGVIGSVLGFALYYHVLQHMEATRVALLTLITPGLALGLGHLLNGETLGARTWIGSATILTGLLLFEFGDRLQERLLPAREYTGQGS